MLPRRTVPFKITGMDSLGQGVSKVTDRITFIPKTAIGDEGEAEVMAEKKGVAFARLKKLTSPAAEREAPPCPHFDQCPSCHYQHVPYESELKYKREALEKLLHKIPTPPIEVVSGPMRLGYRNRVQLHYDRKLRVLGMLDARANTILPIPQCMIGIPALTDELRRLYQGEHWLALAPTHPNRGHVELYLKDGELKISWNRPYAEGGFTQVFEEMNQKLKFILREWPILDTKPTILDLFGGNGNLSNELNRTSRLCVDLYRNVPGEEFYSQDLYGAGAMKAVLGELRRRTLTPQALLLDPPRSGLKDLNSWVEALKPRSIAYVSCDPHTLVRDVGSLEGYSVTRTLLLDFFPSTFHFETMLFLEAKS